MISWTKMKNTNCRTKKVEIGKIGQASFLTKKGSGYNPYSLPADSDLTHKFSSFTAGNENFIYLFKKLQVGNLINSYFADLTTNGLSSETPKRVHNSFGRRWNWPFLRGEKEFTAAGKQGAR